MRIFGSKDTNVIGLDIGTHSIKIVELGGTVAAPKVKGWGVAPTPKGGFNDNAIADTGLVADAVQGLFHDAGLQSKQVAVAVSASHAITKVLSMSAELSELDLEEQVGIEALHFVPYPIDEVNIDFEVIGPSATTEDTVDVLLVACRRSIVNDYIDMLDLTDMSLQYIDIDTYALERICRSQKQFIGSEQQPTALFDIGTNSSHLMVLGQDRVLYSRHQNFGGAQLINLVRREYSVGAREAEGILSSMQLPGDFIAAVQEPFTQQLEQEINRALQFFYSSSAFSSVDNIVLSGMSAGIEGLAPELERRMRTKISVLNPFENVQVMSKRTSAADHTYGLATACGLSLRGLR